MYFLSFKNYGLRCKVIQYITVEENFSLTPLCDFICFQLQFFTYIQVYYHLSLIVLQFPKTCLSSLNKTLVLLTEPSLYSSFGSTFPSE